MATKTRKTRQTRTPQAAAASTPWEGSQMNYYLNGTSGVSIHISGPLTQEGLLRDVADVAQQLIGA